MRGRERRGYLFASSALLFRLATKLVLRRRCVDAHKLPRSGPVIVASNHVSNVDPVVTLLAVVDAGRVPRFLAKAELFRVPVAGAYMRGTGQIPVERRSTNAAAALVPAGRVLDAGGCVVVYPEGTFTSDPNFWPMRGKTGTVRLALMSGAPLVPVAICGAEKVWPPTAKAPRFGRWPKVTVQFGDPVDLSDLMGRADDPDALRTGTARLMKAITALVAQQRGELPDSTDALSA